MQLGQAADVVLVCCVYDSKVVMALSTVHASLAWLYVIYFTSVYLTLSTYTVEGAQQALPIPKLLFEMVGAASHDFVSVCLRDRP